MIAISLPVQAEKPDRLAPDRKGGVSLLTEQQSPSVYEVNFGYNRKRDRFITERELRIWASARNLAVIPDCPQRNLNDGEAAVIPHRGLRFELQARGMRRQFLYLDLVSFAPLQDFQISRTDLYCQGSLEGTRTYPSTTYDLPEVHWLQVRMNGRKTRNLYMGGRVFLQTPVVIPVEREDIRDGTVEIELIPNTGNDYFAIWDAFLSNYPPDQGI